MKQSLRLSFIALIAIIPLSTGHLTEQPVSISLLQICSLLLVLATTVYLISTRQKPRLNLAPELKYALLGLLLALLVGFLATPSLRDSLSFILSRTALPLLAAFAVHQLFYHKIITAKDFVFGLLLSAIALIGVGVLQQLNITPTSDTTARFTLLYLYANTAGRYLMLLFLLLLPTAILEPKTFKLNPAWLLVLGLGLLWLLAKTQSYGSFLALFFGLILTTTLLPKIPARKLLFLSLGLVTLGALIYLPTTHKWERSFSDSKDSRLQYWQVAVGAVKDHPLTGLGFKQWEKTYPQLAEKYASFPIILITSPHPHNFILDSLVKAGPVGLVGFVGLLVWPLIYLWKVLKTGDKCPILIGAAAMLTGLLVFGLADDPLWADDVMVLLPIILAILA